MKKISFLLLIISFSLPAITAKASNPPYFKAENKKPRNEDPYFPFIPERVPIKYVSVAFHVFVNSSGKDSFEPRRRDIAFFTRTIEKLNQLLSDMPPLQPSSSKITSPYISDSRIRIHLDSIYFHVDDSIYNSFSRKGIVRKAASMAYRDYVAENPDLNEFQKENTIHIIISGNHDIPGGQVSGIADKDFILFKGWYQLFKNGDPHADYRNLAHELGHSFGLLHHYAPNNCRQCDDLGCFPLGETNNLMALWPSTLSSLSECQLGIIHHNLDGRKGNISKVVMEEKPEKKTFRPRHYKN